MIDMKKNKRILLIFFGIIFIFGLALGVGYLHETKNSKKNVDTKLEESKNEDPQEEKKDEELQPEEKKEEQKEPILDIDVNIEQVIADYDLEVIRSSIMEDQEYFKWFADAIIKNDKIASDYKRYVFLQYKPVMANKKYLKKDRFLASVKELTISDSSQNIVNGALGVYRDYDTSIIIGNGMKKDVLMHELMHFLDWRLGMGNSSVVYKVGNTYGVTTDDSSAEVLVLPYGKLIVEGGAEMNAVRYHNYMVPGGHYAYLMDIYNLLAIIFGENFMNDVYFSGDGNARLFVEMNKYGVTFEEYKTFMENLDYMSVEENFVGRVEKSEADYFLEGLVFVSNLYNKKNGHDWVDDKVFANVMRFAVKGDYLAFSKLGTSGFSGKQKAAINVEINTNVFQQEVDKGLHSNYYTYTNYLLNGKNYIVIPYLLNGTYDPFYEYIFEYDMVNDKVISKSFIVV